MLNYCRKDKKGKKIEDLNKMGGIIAEAFIEHMEEHESRYFSNIKKSLSANNKTPLDIKTYNEIVNHYNRFNENTFWKVRSLNHESAVRGWRHIMRSTGNLSGLGFGDVKQMQIKAQTNSNTIRITSVNSLIKGLEMLIKILTSAEKSEDLAKELFDEDKKNKSNLFYEVINERLNKDIAALLDEELVKKLKSSYIDIKGEKII